MLTAFGDGLSVLSETWTLVLGVASVTCLVWSVGFFLSGNSARETKQFWRSILLPGCFFAVSLILRLAFVTEAYVPPYFDSVEHYRIIKELLKALETATLLKSIPALTSGYYHLGFHFLASFLTFGLHADPIEVILVLGQAILAAIPIPIFFLLQRETHSFPAAFFGMLLAGFGWYMPGFAINWGKYPALAGFLALEIVLVIAYNLSDKGYSHRGQVIPAGLLVLGIIIATLFHTRTLVIIGISMASWLLAGKIRSLPMNFQYGIVAFSIAGMLVLGKVVQAEPLLNLTLEPYLGDGRWVTITVLALSPFALVQLPRGFHFCFLLILGLLATLFIPIGIRFPGLENQTLLDRPFVEMALYLPLSLLGGLGLAGLLQALKNIHAMPEKANSYIRISLALLLIGFTGLISMGSYDFYPSDCCNFVGYDDTVAIGWLDMNLPLDARILISGTQLSVLPSGPSVNMVGTDAGLWVPALADRQVSLARFDIDFRSESTLEGLCQLQVGYVYVGGTDQAFNATQLNEKPEWYERILFLPNAQLYQLKGCL